MRGGGALGTLRGVSGEAPSCRVTGQSSVRLGSERGNSAEMPLFPVLPPIRAVLRNILPTLLPRPYRPRTPAESAEAIGMGGSAGSLGAPRPGRGWMQELAPGCSRHGRHASGSWAVGSPRGFCPAAGVGRRRGGFPPPSGAVLRPRRCRSRFPIPARRGRGTGAHRAAGPAAEHVRRAVINR